MKIEKIIKPKQQVVSITTKTAVENLQHLIGPTFMKLVSYIQQEEADIVSTPFVSYRNLKEDGQVDGDLVEVEIGFPISKLIRESDEFKSYTLPSYLAMSALFKGSYDDLTSPYTAILERIAAENGHFTGVSYEYYLSDEEISSDQHETILEVVYQ